MTNNGEIKKTPHQHKRLSIFFRRAAVGLIAVIVIAGLSRAMTTFMQTRQQLSTLITDTQALQQQVLETTMQLNRTEDSVRSSKINLDALSTHVAHAQQEQGYQSNDWLLLKARYYLELSSINAEWSDNPPTTLALLQAADALLATLHDPRVFPVREAIAQEITQWQAIAPQDITGLLIQLDAAQQAVNELNVKTSLSLSPAGTTAVETPTPASTWRARLDATLNQLSHLVVIQHHQDANQPLLTPAYANLLRENIRLNLQEAQWAVIQHSPDVYQQSLRQAIQTMKRGFDLKNPVTQSLIQQLTVMQTIPLSKAKPPIGQSLLLLNQVIESIPQHPITSPTTGEQP